MWGGGQAAKGGEPECTGEEEGHNRQRHQMDSGAWDGRRGTRWRPWQGRPRAAACANVGAGCRCKPPPYLENRVQTVNSAQISEHPRADETRALISEHPLICNVMHGRQRSKMSAKVSKKSSKKERIELVKASDGRKQNCKVLQTSKNPVNLSSAHESHSLEALGRKQAPFGV